MLKPEELVDEFIETLKQKAYRLADGETCGNEAEGDYGSWTDWKLALIDFANLCTFESPRHPSPMNKTCPHGEQFVACDKCDRDEARAEIASLESKLDSVTRERDLLAGAAESIHKSIDAYRTENDQLESRLDTVSKDAAMTQSLLTETERICDELRSRLDSYRTALESIAKNSCCAPCREAGLVALKALGGAVERQALVGKTEPIKRLDLPPEITKPE